MQIQGGKGNTMCLKHNQVIELIVMDKQIQPTDSMLCFMCVKLNRQPLNQVVGLDQAKEMMKEKLTQQSAQLEEGISKQLEKLKELQQNMIELRQQLLMNIDTITRMIESWSNELKIYLGKNESIDLILALQLFKEDQRYAGNLMKQNNKTYLMKIDSAFQRLMTMDRFQKWHQELKNIDTDDESMVQPIKQISTKTQNISQKQQHQIINKGAQEKNFNAKAPAIGIDLGTLNSSVGVWINDKVEIILNEKGNKFTQSYVAFNDTQRLIGDAAENQVARNPANTISVAKRLIGTKFSDQIVQNNLKNWPFKVEKGVDDKLLIVVEYKGQIKKFQPEEICSMIISKMKETAEKYLGQRIDKAVLTVPASFKTYQRQAMYDAGIIAGLNVLRIINDSSAAGITFEMMQNSKNENHLLIFNLGGGSFSTSLITIEDSVIEVRATAGNSFLGGEDFDNILVDYCCAEFQKKKGIDIKKNKRSLRRLKTQCERAKRLLSKLEETTIEVDSLIDNEDFFMTISRFKFEDLCMNMFMECITLVDKVFKDSGFKTNQIHEVVLVGGSTRIPKIQQLLKDYFNGKKLNYKLNPEEAVVCGAAIEAAILTGVDNERIKDFLLAEITSFSLGIETAGGIMEFLVERASSIPTKTSQKFTTDYDNQQEKLIKVYEGESKMTKDCQKLGEFKIDGIKPARKGVAEIEITIDIDESYIINITAQVLASKRTNGITIKNSNLSKDELQKLISNVEKFQAEDNIIKQRTEAKNNLENKVYLIKNKLNSAIFKFKLSFDEKKKFQTMLEETLQWIDANPNVEVNDFKKKMSILEETFQKVLQVPA